MSNYRLILASGSPRRKEILENQGIPFEVVKSGREEKTKETIPQKVVRDLSEQKALDVYDQIQGRRNVIILSADTVVAKDGEILGKPEDEEDAVRMLTLLQGSMHEVYTGVTLLLCAEDVKTIHIQEKTEVTMYPMTEEEIRSYVSSGEPMDKAGAYAIQGKCAVFVEKINGDYNNVVGLPVAAVYQELKRNGIDLR
ncbi:septum formation protein Maf [bacterium C-53]|nr:septum formation protein Maf [Lachnospiraceae bacterium]NBI03975.1 septum formation protein Maf [Lachnospiraceae bacterium]RKJ08912.1 septum formation protein Maf [bacterium C-53]